MNLLTQGAAIQTPTKTARRPVMSMASAVRAVAGSLHCRAGAVAGIRIADVSGVRRRVLSA